MATTKVTKGVIADNAVGIDQLDVTDGSNGQVLTTDGAGTLSFSSTPTFSSATVTGDLTVDTDTLVVDSTNNRVGIGTATNDSGIKLDVRGNVRIGDGSDTEQDIHFESANGSWQVGSNDSGNGTSGNQFYIYDTNTSAYNFTVQRGGNIGIGTASPSHLLHLSSTGDASILIEADTDNVNELDNPSLHFSQDGGAVTTEIGIDNGNDMYLKANYSTADMYFMTNATERMRIHSGGQITASYQPCFMCYPTSSFTASSGSVKYTFASEAFDNQNEYNHTTGRFTAPIAGKYLFMAEMALQSSVSALTYAGIGVRVNGSGDVYYGGWGYKADGYSNSSGVHYGKINSSVILNLAQGDYIELYIELSGSHTVLGGNSGTYTRLMGHLLTA